MEIYRPPSYSFPPSRGRKGFELRKNGEFVEIGIGPTDAPTGSVRRWEAPGGDRIEVYDEDERVYVLELVSSSADVLKVRRHE